MNKPQQKAWIVTRQENPDLKSCLSGADHDTGNHDGALVFLIEQDAIDAANDLGDTWEIHPILTTICTQSNIELEHHILREINGSIGQTLKEIASVSDSNTSGEVLHALNSLIEKGKIRADTYYYSKKSNT